MNWLPLAIFGPLFFVAFQSVSKLLPKGTSVFLVNAYGAAAGAILMLAIHLATSSNKSLSMNGKALSMALGMGILISLGNLSLIKAYALGAPQSALTPIFYVLLIMYGIIFGILFFSEKLNWMQFAGMTLAVVGLLITVTFREA